MQIKTTLLVFAVRHFKNKEKTKDYYMLECLTTENEKNDYLFGYELVKVFIDEVVYNSILSRFEPLMKQEFKATISGDRVKYSL